MAYKAGSLAHETLEVVEDPTAEGSGDVGAYVVAESVEIRDEALKDVGRRRLGESQLDGLLKPLDPELYSDSQLDHLPVLQLKELTHGRAWKTNNLGSSKSVLASVLAREPASAAYSSELLKMSWSMKT